MSVVWGPNNKLLGPGSATAGTWPKIASGTLLTTPEAGALEYDGTVIYVSPAAGTRGVCVAEYSCCLASPFTLTSQTASQKLFNASTNGALTLPIGTYYFDCMLSLSSMSATSGNMAFDVLGAGTATLGSILYIAFGVDQVTNTAAAFNNGQMVTLTGTNGTSMVSAATNTGLQARINGTFRVTVAGTIIPSGALTTAAAAVVAAGSFFRCYVVGGASFATVGPWS